MTVLSFDSTEDRNAFIAARDYAYNTVGQKQFDDMVNDVVRVSRNYYRPVFHQCFPSTNSLRTHFRHMYRNYSCSYKRPLQGAGMMEP